MFSSDIGIDAGIEGASIKWVGICAYDFFGLQISLGFATCLK